MGAALDKLAAEPRDQGASFQRTGFPDTAPARTLDKNNRILIQARQGVLKHVAPCHVFAYPKVLVPILCYVARSAIV